ncbi:MAG: hypothetical protein LBG05_10735 [Treponema sp.]|jgi:hypothetical protein|nr:hypothetical protein [Treponema sp.]
MKMKTILLTVFFVLVAGSLSAQVRFWWWGRAQLTPFERPINPGATDVDSDGSINAHIWWTKFGVNASNGERTAGFDAEMATMMKMTNDDGANIFSSWIENGDFYSYSLWIRPVNQLFVRVGKYNYDRDTGWPLDFFDRVRYTDSNGLAEDEFFAGYDNMMQSTIKESTFIPGTPEYSAGTSIPVGALFEGYFGTFTVDINFKGIDSTMDPLDYLQTIQVGARYDLKGIGFFRLQMIGFDPDGKITGNYNKRDGATSQIQAAANITALPGFDFRMGFHYYLSQCDTMWGSRFTSDKGAVSIPMGVEVSLFNPFSFRILGDIQLGTDRTYGKAISNYKIGGQLKYVHNVYLTSLLNVSAYNIGKYVNGIYYEDKKPRVDIAAGVQVTNFLTNASIQTGVVVQIPTYEGTQIGIAIPITFEMGVF